jgi:hypothetical protein
MSRRDRNKESGQALIFGVVTLSLLLMGVAGMGIDMGYMRYQKRLQQTAADAAAIAGASNLAYGGVTTAAQAAAVANGFTDSSGNTVSTCTGSLPTALPTNPATVCVQINNPPTSGPHMSDANYVEAYVSVVQPAFFMRLLGTNSEPITARAVATTTSGGVNSGCLYTLGTPKGKIEGVNVTGNATLNATTCGINDNGNYDPTGGALTINAGTFGVSGSCSGSGCGKTSKEVTCADQSSTNCPSYSTPAAADPLAYLGTPTPGTPAAFNTSNIQPGTYTATKITGNGSYVFPSGTYYFTGDLGCTGNASLSGTGVTFVFINATMNCTGTGVINLSAPTSGTYQGVVLYQEACGPATTCNGPSLGGNNGSSYSGAVYFPSSEVTFFGHANSISVGIVVADSFALSGDPTVNLQGAAGLGPLVNYIKNAVLVE